MTLQLGHKQASPAHKLSPPEGFDLLHHLTASSLDSTALRVVYILGPHAIGVVPASSTQPAHFCVEKWPALLTSRSRLNQTLLGNSPDLFLPVLRDRSLCLSKHSMRLPFMGIFTRAFPRPPTSQTSVAFDRPQRHPMAHRIHPLLNI